VPPGREIPQDSSPPDPPPSRAEVPLPLEAVVLYAAPASVSGAPASV